jgi:hypothetical protein
MNTVNISKDPCDTCSGLCCKVYQIEDSRIPKKPHRTILIKSAWEMCQHRWSHGCTIYDTRTDLGYAICPEYSCYGVGAMVDKWVQKHRLSSDMSRIVLNKARKYIQELLDFDSKEAYQKRNTKDHADWLMHIWYIIDTSPTEIIWVSKYWDSFIFPRRWYTPSEIIANQKSEDQFIRQFIKPL